VIGVFFYDCHKDKCYKDKCLLSGSDSCVDGYHRGGVGGALG
jgi:hypothetical protein